MTAGGANVVITDCDHGTVEPERRVLAEAGHALRLAQCRTPEDVIREAAGAEALINQYAPIDASVLGALEGCRVVVRYGVGVDTVDVEEAARRGVWVANVPDYGTEEVSDHALGLALALLRGIGALDRSVRAGGWDFRLAPPRRVASQTLGAVGSGRIGSALIRKAAALGMRVLATDPAGVSEEAHAAGAEETSFDELLAAADVVSLHLPLTAETRHLIGAEQLGRMKQGAYLVNTSRGGLVDTDALLRALDDGRLAGAGLDVLEREPPEPRSRILGHERVILTPHAAWHSPESFERLKTEAAREVVRVLAGEPPRSPVNQPSQPAVRA